MRTREVPDMKKAYIFGVTAVLVLAACAVGVFVLGTQSKINVVAKPAVDIIPTVTEIPETPTVDESDALKDIIKSALVAKHGNVAEELTVTVKNIVGGDYAQGEASATGGGGLWFAAKVKGNWMLVWDGNGIIRCSDLTKYPEYPKTMIPQCYNDTTDKMVVR
jgi:hypothetical protein